MAKGRKTGGRKPGSRNKATREIKELAGALVPEAMKQLGSLLRSSKTGEPAKVRAIEIVFERAFGKAPQAIQHSGAVGTYDLTQVSDADLDQLEDILSRAAIAAGYASAKSGGGEG